MPKSSNDETLVLVTDTNFVEDLYLEANPDVARAIDDGIIESGRLHFDLYGRNEGRKMRKPSTTTIVMERIVPRFIRSSLRPSMAKDLPYRRLQQQLNQVQAHLSDLQVRNAQLESILRLEHHIPPAPPKHLQVRVVGSYVPDFIASGFNSIYPDINRVLQTAGKTLKDFHTILDFGCGCGRAIRAFASLLPECRLYGTDIDQEAIEWLQANCSSLAEYSVAPHLPPTGYRDESFDFIFGISVFTHLPEDMQFQWLSELSRITKPGGYAVMTTHGEKHYSKLNAAHLLTMKTKGFLYVDSQYGESISLPEFYQTAFHSPAYIQKEWSRYFDVVDIQPLGIQGHQDAVLLLKRS